MRVRRAQTVGLPRTLIRRFAPPSPGGRREKATLRCLLPWLPWLRWGSVAILTSLLLLDLLFPLPLPSRRDTSIVVSARDGSPLRAFADAQGIWRYPTRIEQVSPLYVQALLAY